MLEKYMDYQITRQHVHRQRLAVLLCCRYSSGTAIKVIQEVAENYQEDMILTGISADEVSQGNQAIWVFICLVCVVLAAQYESFILPLSVILSLPAGIFGAFLC
jgi:HAE1 family hydrophobic/amphiphilic exporter-1